MRFVGYALPQGMAKPMHSLKEMVGNAHPTKKSVPASGSFFFDNGLEESVIVPAECYFKATEQR